MLSILEAHRVIMELASPLPAERTPLLEGLGRVLAAPVTAPFTPGVEETGIAPGARLLEAGLILTPSRIALLAGLGKAHVAVHAPARVAILTVGPAPAEPGAPLAPGQRYDGPAFALAALVAEAGGVPVRVGAVPEEAELLARQLKAALRFDAILIQGGDRAAACVAQALKAVGEVHLEGESQHPCVSLVFGSALSKPIIGLCGSGARLMVCFEAFVRPALRKMMGHRAQERPRVLAVARDGFDKPAGRQALVPARVYKTARGYELELAPNATESPSPLGTLADMAGANGLAVVPPATTAVAAGDTLETILLEAAELCGMACLPLGGETTAAKLATGR